MARQSMLRRYTWSLSAVLGLGGFIIIALAQWLIPERAGWYRDLPTEIGIAITSGGIVGFVYENLIRSDLVDEIKTILADIVDTDARRLGITAIFDSRTDKSRRVQLKSLIQDARKELMFVGVGLGPIMTEYSDDLSGAMARGCDVRFLIFDLRNGPAGVLEASLGKGDLIANLTGSFGSAISFLRTDETHRKFELRVFDVVPTFGAVAVDRAEGDGRIFLELNCFHSSGDQCPGFALEKRAGGLFYTYDRQIAELWRGATPIERAAVKDPAKSTGVASPAA
jgi:hypothetical protein